MKKRLARSVEARFLEKWFLEEGFLQEGCFEEGCFEEGLEAAAEFAHGAQDADVPFADGQ